MPLTPKENNIPLSKFESMLKTDSIYFFDSVEFEEIIHYYIDIGKGALAKKAIKLGLKQHPNSIIIKLLQAELLIFDGLFEEASFLLKEIQAIEPTNSEVYVQQASINSKNGNHHKAIALLQTALECTDDEIDVLSLIGMEYLFLDNFEAARLSFEKCLEIDYEDYSSLYNIVYCFDMEKKHAEAIVYLTKYIDTNPYCEIAWHQLGRQYFIQEKYEEALQAFDYAVVIDEYFVGAYLEKAKTLEQLKKYKEAIENYKITIALEDPTSFAFLRIGECYEKLNKSTLAILFFKKALHEDPLLDKGWFMLANLHLKKNNLRKALYCIKKTIEIDEQNSLYWRKYAEINIKLNFYEEAVKAFQQCLVLDDLELDVWIGLSDALCLLEEYEEALVNLIEAATIFNNFSEINYRISGLYFKFENVNKGANYLEKALEEDYEYHIILKELFPNVYTLKTVQDIIKNFK